jgi:hypothetical protein
MKNTKQKTKTSATQPLPLKQRRALNKELARVHTLLATMLVTFSKIRAHVNNPTKLTDAQFVRLVKHFERTSGATESFLAAKVYG